MWNRACGERKCVSLVLSFCKPNWSQRKTSFWFSHPTSYISFLFFFVFLSFSHFLWNSFLKTDKNSPLARCFFFQMLLLLRSFCTFPVASSGLPWRVITHSVPSTHRHTHTLDLWSLFLMNVVFCHVVKLQSSNILTHSYFHPLSFFSAYFSVWLALIHTHSHLHTSSQYRWRRKYTTYFFF